MSTRDGVDDPPRKPTAPDRAKLLDRVFYATGAMLDATDFTDEQAYHRGRLARALAYCTGPARSPACEWTSSRRLRRWSSFSPGWR